MDEQETMKVRVGAVRQDPGEDTFSPLVDIYEAEDGTTVLAVEIPGATADSLDIRVDKGVLSISADARCDSCRTDYTRTYSGFVRGQYFRTFAISDEIDRDKIEASLADGVLALRLPRAAAAKTRRIEIKEE